MLNDHIQKLGSLVALLALTLLAQPALADDGADSQGASGQETHASTGSPTDDGKSAREATVESNQESNQESDEDATDGSTGDNQNGDDNSGSTLSADALKALNDMGGSKTKKKDDSAMREMSRGRTSSDEESLDIGDVDTSEQKQRKNGAEADLGEYSEYEVFESTINNRSHQVGSCFAKHLDSETSAKAVVRFRISGSGEVKGAGVINAESVSDELTRCIVETVQDWRFPAPRSGQASTISHPFTYGSK